MKDEINIGPIAVAEQIEHLQDLVNDSVSMGGTLVIGGNPNTDDKGIGRFYEPTIIANSNNGMRLMSDQFFGPLVAIQEVENHE